MCITRPFDARSHRQQTTTTVQRTQRDHTHSSSESISPALQNQMKQEGRHVRYLGYVDDGEVVAESSGVNGHLVLGPLALLHHVTDVVLGAVHLNHALFGVDKDE